jgi:hypothetical protein
MTALTDRPVDPPHEVRDRPGEVRRRTRSIGTGFFEGVTAVGVSYGCA